jgi:hypothetical protein
MNEPVHEARVGFSNQAVPNHREPAPLEASAAAHMLATVPPAST